MSALPQVAFKVLTAEQFSGWQAAGVFAGAPVDLADGYIHLSAADQLVGTIEKHFAGQTGLVIAAIDLAALGDTVRWEPSRGGALFPHVYGVLPMQALAAYGPLAWAKDGSILLPAYLLATGHGSPLPAKLALEIPARKCLKPFNMEYDVHIIGGGLAGSEAAWQLARRGIRVRLSEMRGGGGATEAHQTQALAELVCSNSFRSDDDVSNAVGLLHHEMRALDSLVMASAAKAQVPAGSALAVDRDVFSAEVEASLAALPSLEVVRERIDVLPEAGLTIVATGPLTAEALAHSIGAATGSESLAFFDAIAPIVHRDSIDMDVCWMASRWDKGETKDYINCPMDREQYAAFHAGLIAGEKTSFKQWEENTPYFNGCMPIEVMAERGFDTLRFGPMKPVGLDNPHDATPEFPKGRWPHAVVQLRQDNKLGTLWNMVGFQTKLKHAEQVRLFRTIPGLENAEFARLGGLHRNTFINSPVLLDRQLRLKTAPHVLFAGQITGCEGYVESAAVGLVAGLMAAAELGGQAWQSPPPTTALGALLSHVTGDADAETYQPMNINFGLFPPLHDVKKKSRKQAYTDRAKHDLVGWIPLVG